MKMVDANHRVAPLGRARPRTRATRSGTVIPVMTPLPATPPSRLADWLGLAAAPTFAMMALLTGMLGGGSADILCSAMQASSFWCGMVPMYVLMSAFHSAPWIRMLSGVGVFRYGSPGLNGGSLSAGTLCSAMASIIAKET
jgi:hypothetical protein